MASEELHKGLTRDQACDSLNVDIGGSTIEIVGATGVSGSDIRRAIDSGPFKQWLTNLKGRGGILAPATLGGASCSLKRIIIQSVDMFGQRVGFVKFKAEVVDIATGKMLPGIVFARGGAVGILILLACDGEKYAGLTEQARVPVGRVILELPAGMLDDDAGDFTGTAAREVEEETGIHIKTSDLICLTDFLDESTGRKIFPSPGGCDEEITLMLYRGYVKQEVIDSLQGQQTGLQDHGEFIRVRVVPYKTLWQATADSKVLAAVALYEMAKREGVLRDPPNAPKLNNL